MTDSLLERVRKATGPDRILDACLWEAFATPQADDRNLDIFRQIVARMKRGGDDSECPAYTASLDAVIALVEQELVGWYWDLHLRFDRDGDAWYTAVLYNSADEPPEGEERRMRANCFKATPALALLLAFLQARTQGGT